MKVLFNHGCFAFESFVGIITELQCSGAPQVDFRNVICHPPQIASPPEEDRSLGGAVPYVSQARRLMRLAHPCSDKTRLSPSPLVQTGQAFKRTAWQRMSRFTRIHTHIAWAGESTQRPVRKATLTQTDWAVQEQLLCRNSGSAARLSRCIYHPIDGHSADRFNLPRTFCRLPWSVTTKC